MAQKAIPEKAKSQANQTASANAYAQTHTSIKKGEKRSKIKTKRIFASHACGITKILAILKES
jgi:hypothetical protein